MNFSLPDVNPAWLVIIGIFLMAVVMIIGGTIWQWLNSAPAQRPPVEGGRPSAPTSAPAAPRPRSLERRRVKYRTLDGSEDYEFYLVHLSGGWRIYILDQPSYNGWPDDSHSTHRHFDGDHPYICWDVPITTLEDARKITARWTQGTEVYRKTGKKF